MRNKDALSDEKISNVVVDSDEDDEYDVAAAIGKKQRTRLRTRTGCGSRKANQVVLHQFAKAKKQLRRIRSKSKRALVPSSSSSQNATATVSGKNKIIIRGDDGGTSRSGCKFCFSRPKVLESPNESPTPTVDPNNPNFTHALIEKNNFYSKECNPHLD